VHPVTSRLWNVNIVPTFSIVYCIPWFQSISLKLDNQREYARLWIITAVLLKIQVIWVLRRVNWSSCLRCEVLLRLRVRGRAVQEKESLILVNSSLLDEGTMLLQSVGNIYQSLWSNIQRGFNRRACLLYSWNVGHNSPVMIYPGWSFRKYSFPYGNLKQAVSMSHVARFSVPPTFSYKERQQNSVKRAPRESVWSRIGPSASK
jgi:hypothetical protein